MKWCTYLLLALILTGCAARESRVGVYPSKGQNVDQQAQDTSECRDAAMNMAGSKGQEAAVGAVSGVVIGATIGAILGAVGGAFFGVPGEGAALGAALGGAGGGIQGVGYGLQTNDQVYLANYRACMSARGYAIGG